MSFLGWWWYILCLASLALAVPEDWLVGSSRAHDAYGDLSFAVPNGTQPGDLLVLLLSRSDDDLPIAFEDWEYAASCFKSSNGQRRCFTECDCVSYSYYEGYCSTFRNDRDEGGGHDLATVVFVQPVRENTTLPTEIGVDLRGYYAAWGFLLAVRGVDAERPVRAFATTSNDKSPQSTFPAVPARKGDLLLLSMAFDDFAAESAFGPPQGTTWSDYVSGDDEAGFVYAKRITTNRFQQALETQGGPGGPAPKDALVAVVLKGTEAPAAAQAPDFRVCPQPTAAPTPQPTRRPTTRRPTRAPTPMPTPVPTVTPVPTASSVPSPTATPVPTRRPTTRRPTQRPTRRPTTPRPTRRPTPKPQTTPAPTTPAPTTTAPTTTTSTTMVWPTTPEPTSSPGNAWILPPWLYEQIWWL